MRRWALTLAVLFAAAGCDRGTIGGDAMTADDAGSADAGSGDDATAGTDTGGGATGADTTEAADTGAGSADTTGGGGADATAPVDTTQPVDTAAPGPDVSVDPDTGGGGGGACPEPTGERPQAMGELDGVVDEARGRAVLFGGDTGFPVQCESKPDYTDQTWALDLACMQWKRLGILDEPQARGRHLSVLDTTRDRMLIFGGRWRLKGTTGAYTLFDDVWALDLATDAWTEVTTKGAKPPARWGTAGVYDPVRDRLVIFGGNVGTSGATYQPSDDTWTLDLKTGTWEKLGASGPKKRLFADAAYDAERGRMILFGGTTAFFGPFLNDTWALDLATESWTQLQAGGKSAPEPRIRPELVSDSTRDRLVLFGGHDDGSVGNRNDVWTLDLASATWKKDSGGDLQNPESPSPGFCAFPPDFVLTDAGAPERREGHVLLAWEAGDLAVLFGGKTDCGIVDDLWTLGLGSLGWTEQIEATVGESCERAGGEGCHDLCF